jgi:predicted ribosome quality control (RQC) complex YloA/Tae2 family protein
LESKVKIRLLKFWQTEEGSLFWQINPYDSDDKNRYPKKAFLILTTTPKPSLSISTQKPGRIKPSGQFVSLLRKHAPAGALLNVWISKTLPKTQLLEISSKGQIHYISLENSRPPVISLNSGDPLTSFCRLTPKSCYTKKQLAPSFDLSHFENISFVDLLNELEEQASELELSSEEDSNLTSETDDDTLSPFSKYQKESAKRLRRRKKTFKKSFDKSTIELNKLSQGYISEIHEKAKLLQTYAYLVKPGEFSLTLDKNLTGLTSKIEIELDPEKSTGANIENYFSLAKKSEKKLASLKSQTNKLEKENSEIDKDLSRLSSEDLPDETVASILNKHGLKADKQTTNQSNKTSSSPFRKFKTPDGHTYFVGKGPKENDELTKNAKSNDYWVHTSELPGSHVIIPRSTIKDGALSQLQIRQAGMLSIHFSKLREGRAGEVYVTKKHYLKKKKGLAPGLWLVEKSETVFIRYTEEEIKSLLDTLEL